MQSRCEVVERTIRTVRHYAETGRFVYYFAPAREHPKRDPVYIDSQYSGDLEMIMAGELLLRPDLRQDGAEKRQWGFTSLAAEERKRSTEYTPRIVTKG